MPKSTIPNKSAIRNPQSSMTKPPVELLEFLHRHDPAIQSLALGLRRVVLEEIAPCHEYIFAMGPRVVLLYGLTERVIADCICSVAVFRRHVNLQFHRGSELPDKLHVLEGDGKRMRHITLKKLSELDRPELRAYLRQARKRAPVGKRAARIEEGVVTRIKRQSAPPRSAYPLPRL